MGIHFPYFKNCRPVPIPNLIKPCILFSYVIYSFNVAKKIQFVFIIEIDFY